MPIRIRRSTLLPTLAEALSRTPDPKSDPDTAPAATFRKTREVAATATIPDIMTATTPATADAPQPPFLSLPEAAEWLCVSISTLKRLVTKGELVAVQVGARRKIPANFLSAYVKRGVLILDDVTEISSPDQQ